MELCECNLDDYLKKRENKITINEIREVLIQLNNTFKRSREKKIIRKDLKPKNILISLNKLDKCLIKLSDYGISKFIDFNDSKEETFYGSIYTMSPEVIENGEEKLTEKSEIWSLGVTIYYLLFREYPFNGKTEVELFEDIISKKKLKITNNILLDDLISKMLIFNDNERISWNEYFNHNFFKIKKIIKPILPKFNFICNTHSKKEVGEEHFSSLCGMAWVTFRYAAACGMSDTFQGAKLIIFRQLTTTLFLCRKNLQR
jgi:serine/threonine protein kinase